MQHDKYSSVYSDEELFARLRGIRHVALDMDGTIYMGMSLFDYTKPFLARLKQMGITYSFLTNNPSTSIADYLKKLAGMGIEATADPSPLCQAIVHSGYAEYDVGICEGGIRGGRG